MSASFFDKFYVCKLDSSNISDRIILIFFHHYDTLFINTD